MSVFVSTRGSAPTDFVEALFQGMPPDGGLFVPAELPRLDAGGAGLPGGGSADSHFTASSLWAAERLLAGCFPGDALARVITRSLDFQVPLVELEDGVHVLELFHGPSLAFKDVGARFMAAAMAEADAGGRTILVATSGDTGGAVASAFHDVADTRVVVLFPRDGVSARQRRQMTTLGGNVTAAAVAGSFDDCQRMAKAAFGDLQLRSACGLTSANSINVGRLLPQTFYYAHAAATLGWDDAPPTFVVPSGNLGNICAGLLAHRAGVPAAGFIAASNSNRVFPDYLEAGRFEPRPSVRTVSNAMDVGDPSNLERIRWLFDDDVEALRRDVTAVSCDDDETLSTIADVFRRTGYVFDPHGAVAYRAAQKAQRRGPGPVVVLATAHPAKFPDPVEQAIGQVLPIPPALADRMSEDEHCVEIQPSDSDLRRLLMEHAPS
jgi:threonine synthase